MICVGEVLRDHVSVWIHETDLALRNYFINELLPSNLAPQQTLILMLLGARDGINQNEIAERLNREKTNVARIIANLEQKGLIRRESSEKDGRALRVFLTAEGKRLSDCVSPLVDEFYDVVTNGITDEELVMLSKILSKIRSNVCNRTLLGSSTKGET